MEISHAVIQTAWDILLMDVSPGLPTYPRSLFFQHCMRATIINVIHCIHSLLSMSTAASATLPQPHIRFTGHEREVSEAPGILTVIDTNEQIADAQTSALVMPLFSILISSRIAKQLLRHSEQCFII